MAESGSSLLTCVESTDSMILYYMNILYIFIQKRVGTPGLVRHKQASFQLVSALDIWRF